jgi:putative oxidoreductase
MNGFGPIRATCEPWIDLMFRIFLGGVFIAAAVPKIIDVEAFAISIATYQLLPLSLINLQAIVLPWLELITGVLLIVGFRTKAQALAINGMLVMFIAAIYIAMSKGIEAQCGCFGAEAEETMNGLTWTKIIEDAGWLLIGLYVMLGSPNRISLDTWISRLRGRNGGHPCEP